MTAGRYWYQWMPDAGVWTVGTGDGESWEPDSDHDSEGAAEDRVRELNNGPPIPYELMPAARGVAEVTTRLDSLDARLDAIEAGISELRAAWGVFLGGDQAAELGAELKPDDRCRRVLHEGSSWSARCELPAGHNGLHEGAGLKWSRGRDLP